MTYCGQEEITPHRNMSRPSASIKVSMNCDYSGFSQGQTTKHPKILWAGYPSSWKLTPVEWCEG
jgi:hypothetical protein